MSQTITTAGMVRLDLAAMNRLRAEIAKTADMRAKVGVLGRTTARPDAGTIHNPQGLTNAEIGLKNEFGSKADNVPARSFLRVPLMTQLPRELRRIPREQWFASIMQKGMYYALKQLGILAEGVVLQGFRTRGFGQWAPNAPLTVFLKGSDSPLIDRGELRQSIVSEVVKKIP